MAKRIIWQKPKIRTDEDDNKERRVSWLELFFDLFSLTLQRDKNEPAGPILSPVLKLSSGIAAVAIGIFLRNISAVLLTAAPENIPSVRTIEKLGAPFIDEIDIALYEAVYGRGECRKRRYVWHP